MKYFKIVKMKSGGFAILSKKNGRVVPRLSNGSQAYFESKGEAQKEMAAQEKNLKKWLEPG